MPVNAIAIAFKFYCERAKFTDKIILRRIKRGFYCDSTVLPVGIRWIEHEFLGVWGTVPKIRILTLYAFIQIFSIDGHFYVITTLGNFHPNRVQQYVFFNFRKRSILNLSRQSLIIIRGWIAVTQPTAYKISSFIVVVTYVNHLIYLVFVDLIIYPHVCRRGYPRGTIVFNSLLVHQFCASCAFKYVYRLYTKLIFYLGSVTEIVYLQLFMSSTIRRCNNIAATAYFWVYGEVVDELYSIFRIVCKYGLIT